MSFILSSIAMRSSNLRVRNHFSHYIPKMRYWKLLIQNHNSRGTSSCNLLAWCQHDTYSWHVSMKHTRDISAWHILVMSPLHSWYVSTTHTRDMSAWHILVICQHYTYSWYVSMTRTRDMSAWHVLVICQHDNTCDMSALHILVMSAWHILVICQHDIHSWYVSITHTRDMSAWHILVICQHDTYSWYVSMTHTRLYLIRDTGAKNCPVKLCVNG
jgi:hypothetical protein